MLNEIDDNETEDNEAAFERVMNDARHGAIKPNALYKGRSIEDIDEDIALIRKVLDMEL